VRTLTRACLAADGRTPKELIDQRVLLEAQRLLAWTDADTGTIGRQLGFRDASAFGAFFRRTAGEAPGAFRRRIAQEVVGLELLTATSADILRTVTMQET